MNNDLERILDYLNWKRGFDFSGYSKSMVKRRVSERLSHVKRDDYQSYLKLLMENNGELDNLIDVLTIKVSSFFRDSMTFEYIGIKILPDIINEKKESREGALRVWSTSCSHGEEPYSMAILISEIIQREQINITAGIFATDIDPKALKKAKKGVYNFESVKNIKYGLLKKYFISRGAKFHLINGIKEMVSFSNYNLLDMRSFAPPESVFGGFDMVLCRNILIYFNAEHREFILDKLKRALSPNGYLVLGMAEIPWGKHRNSFNKVNDLCQIYKKC